MLRPFDRCVSVSPMKIFSTLFLQPERPTAVSLDDVICQLNGREAWTLRDAFEGVHIFGGTGSGKTSGSGRHFALAMLRAGFGGLILTVKTDEAAQWERLAAEAGRSRDIRFIRPGRSSGVKAEHPINFLQYEQENAGTEAQASNLTSLFLTAVRAMDNADTTPEQAYWADSLRQLLSSSITLLELAGKRLTVPALTELVLSTAHDLKEAKSIVWNRDSVCAQLIREASTRITDTDCRAVDLSRVVGYFTRQLPGLPENTRSSVISTYTTKADMLLDGVVRELLCGETSPEVTPDRTHEGAIVVVDMPVLRWNELGRFAQLLIKSVWQRATLRRPPGGRPVFLWADESQHFVTEEDYKFLQTARSARAATVYLTQNVSNYYAMMNGRNSQASTNALLGGFQTKIFHANGDGETNRWAEDLFGHDVQVIRQPNYESGLLRIDRHPFRQPVIPSKAFTELGKGGRRGITEAFVFQAGRQWRGGQGNFIKATFQQGRLSA
jgi:type IV secretory pathway TraG/TraD family ATPase VirD4